MNKTIYSANAKDLNDYMEKLKSQMNDLNKIMEPYIKLQSDIHKEMRNINFILELRKLPCAFIFEGIPISDLSISEEYTPRGGSASFGDDWDEYYIFYIRLSLGEKEYRITYKFENISSAYRKPYNIRSISNLDKDIMTEIMNSKFGDRSDLDMLWKNILAKVNNRVDAVFAFIIKFLHNDDEKTKRHTFGKYYSYKKVIFKY